MPIPIHQMIQEAANHESEDMLRLLKTLQEVNSSFSTYTLDGSLVRITGQDRLAVLGDIHGDLETLVKILTSLHMDEMLKVGEGLTLFLGDYADRGTYPLEVLHLLLSLKSTKPEQIILLRGNHEPPPDLIPYPHDLPQQSRQRYGSEGEAVYKAIFSFFQRLPVAAVDLRGIFYVHGGVPTKTVPLLDIARASIDPTLMEELLWNDPVEHIEDHEHSDRGAGYHFGRAVTDAFLRMNNLSYVVSGHRPCEGFTLNHGGRILTLFSMKGRPYYNSKAAYLDLPPGPLEGTLRDYMVYVE